MPQLIGAQGMSINIAEAIGDKWRVVGIALLDDKRGAIVEGISDQFQGKAEKINVEVLQR